MKLGKLPQKIDARTFQLRKLLVAANLPPLPAEFDADGSCPNLLDNFMFANDKYGDCVIAGRAHMTLRFECFEQKKIIVISDTDVLNAYWHETGGNDSGLIMLDSLRVWRKEGWTAAGNPYNIYAFAQVTIKHHDDVKYSVLLLNGAYIGLNLPLSAKSQLGKVWEVGSGPDSEVGSWGGHCVYVKSYNAIGPVCVTWGKPQQMTWAFLDKYCDEAYAVIDNRNTWIDPANNPLNCELLESLLKQFCDSPIEPNPNPPSPPTPPEPWYQGIVDFFQAILNAIRGWFK